MIGWITSFKERKEAKKREMAERRAAQKEAAEQKVMLRKADMLKRPCPINKNDKCSENCVHFREGSVLYMPSFRPPVPGYWNARLPQCRLWFSR